MNIKDFLNSFEIDELIENLLLYFPYTAFPSLENMEKYYKVGLNNVKNHETNKNSDSVLTLFNDGISDRETCCILKDGKIYGLLFNKWDDTLSMSLDESLYEKYSKPYIACIIMLDLFFHGNTEKSNETNIESIINGLEKTEIDFALARPAEEVFAELNEKFKDLPKTPKVGEKYKNIHNEIFEVILIGSDISKENNLIVLRNEKGENLIIPENQMFKDLSHIKFSDNIERKYRFEKV